MKRWLKRIRDGFVFMAIVVSWAVFLVFAKVKWLLIGPRVLRVEPETMRCIAPEDWVKAAKRCDVGTFKERRMSNRRRKVVGANWEILYETETEVFYGRPLIVFGAGGFRSWSDFGVEEWFCVAKTELEREFPDYATEEGVAMRARSPEGPMV